MLELRLFWLFWGPGGYFTKKISHFFSGFGFFVFLGIISENQAKISRNNAKFRKKPEIPKFSEFLQKRKNFAFFFAKFRVFFSKFSRFFFENFAFFLSRSVLIVSREVWLKNRSKIFYFQIRFQIRTVDCCFVSASCRLRLINSAYFLGF